MDGRIENETACHVEVASWVDDEHRAFGSGAMNPVECRAAEVDRLQPEEWPRGRRPFDRSEVDRQD